MGPPDITRADALTPLTPLGDVAASPVSGAPETGRRRRSAKAPKAPKAAKAPKPGKPPRAAKPTKPPKAAKPVKAAKAGQSAKAAKPEPDGALAAYSNEDEVLSTKWYQTDWHFGGPVKPEVVMGFSRQLASFIEAGISILEGLEIVGEEIGAEEMKTVITKMRLSIQRGGSFSDAIGAHEKVFPPYYRAMVRSAEYTGRLDEVLNQLANYLERDINAKRQVKSALTYPTVVLCVAIAAMVVMSVFVLPKFASMYRGLGAKLPLPTRMLLGATDFVTGSWYLILGTVGGVFALTMLVLGGKRSKRRRDRLAMKLPVIGDLFHVISIERFCRVLSALSKAGVPLPDAIQMSSESTNNTVFQTKLEHVSETLIRGGGLSAPMFEAGIFPIAARQMIRVGERTGSLASQLSKAASYYEREVTFKLKRATELFQPAVILFVGFLVGFIAVAQVSAMYSIFNQVHT
jgi:type IV pilus assembly protein PilC